MTNSIWGWGGVRFVYGALDVTFSTSFVKLDFDPVMLRSMLADYTYSDKLKGFRALLSVDLLNYDDGDSAKVITLIGIINNSLADNAAITVYPKYGGVSDTGWSGTFRYDGKMGFDDLAKNVFIGQSAQLDFIGAALVDTIPDNASSPTQVLRVHNGADLTSYRVYDASDSQRKTE